MYLHLKYILLLFNVLYGLKSTFYCEMPGYTVTWAVCFYGSIAGVVFLIISGFPIDYQGVVDGL